MTFATQLAAAFTPIAAVYDDASVSRALTWAQSFVEDYCDRTFDLVTGDVVFLDPKPYHQALLPQIPVASVSAVQAWLPSNGAMSWVSLVNFAFIADTGLIYDTSGLVGAVSNVVGYTWPWLPGSLQVTYDHGYSNVPQGLVDSGCRMAQQYLENPALQMQRRTGDTEGRYAGSVGIVLNDLDKRILDRYTDIGIA